MKKYEASLENGACGPRAPEWCFGEQGSCSGARPRKGAHGAEAPSQGHRVTCLGPMQLAVNRGAAKSTAASFQALKGAVASNL